MMMIESRTLDLPLSSGCKNIQSSCTSGTQCCSGNCQTNRCCRSSGQQVPTPSECCFSFIPNTNGFFCCSQHAQPCKTDADCCPGKGKCSKGSTTISRCI